MKEGTLTRDSAKELISCLWIKFNNHPAPPKVGVTAAESGTFTDFANINLGGLLPDGSDGSNEVSHLLLEIIDEMHLLQPSSNLQLSRKSPDAFLKHALRVIRQGLDPHEGIVGDGRLHGQRAILPRAENGLQREDHAQQRKHAQHVGQNGVRGFTFHNEHPHFNGSAVNVQCYFSPGKAGKEG